MAVTATILVDFAQGGGDGGAAGHLSAELDDREDGLNNGLTTFQPGDTAYFLVFKSENVTHDAPIPSAGTIATATAGTVTREDQITFANVATGSLPVPALAITDHVWMGTSLGALTLGDDKMTVTAASAGVAVCKVTYTTQPEAYGLTSPASINGETEFDILVYIHGQVTG